MAEECGFHRQPKHCSFRSTAADLEGTPPPTPPQPSVPVTDMEVVQISDLSPSHTGLPSMSPLSPLTVFTASLTYLAGKRVPYLQIFPFQLALSLVSDFVTDRVKT